MGKIIKTKKEVDDFKTKAKCGKIIKSRSEKLLKHNLKVHEDYCEECKNA